jgi:hypothetical protein
MRHLKTHLLPITRFRKEELDEAVERMKEMPKRPFPVYDRHYFPIS